MDWGPHWLVEVEYPFDLQEACSHAATMSQAIPRYFLRQVRLSRFKAVSNEQQISLSPLSVLIGRNGSGKSTLIESLQWIDAALRGDANAACDRYRGIRDLLNKKSGGGSFSIKLTWSADEQERTESQVNSPQTPVEYSVEVKESARVAGIAHEQLSHGGKDWIKTEPWWATRISTSAPPRTGPTREFNGRVITFPDADRIRLASPDRLALDLVPKAADETWPVFPLVMVRHFFRDAVFLRLSPKSLSQPARVLRSSNDPILDEEGATLPALLLELNEAQRAEVVAQLQQVLPDVCGLGVSAPGESDLPVYYHLLEALSAPDAAMTKAMLPSWMLSEGTRRLTALFALLARDPPPSLLCIEEIENGLDPWTVVAVLDALRSATARGVQVLITTHSPWFLDHVRLDEIIRVRRVAGETHYERFVDDAEVRAFRDGVPPGLRYVRAE